MKTIKERAEQAIKDGYRYCIRENFEDVVIHLSDIVATPEHYEGGLFILCDKTPQKMRITSDEIADLIIDKFDNQEEFYSDDWSDSLMDCDTFLDQLSEKINANLSNRNFWFPSNLEL